METTVRNRVTSLDLLRGLVMIIMALDHTRDFFHFDAYVHDPLDPTVTSPYLYFTRWITHLCAPTFVFLAGISIFLQCARKTKSELSAFLFKRGLWLILIEFIVISFAWTFDPSYRVIVMQVIWAIGISMILMAGMIYLPFNAILVTGLIIVGGHNILDSIESTKHGFFWDVVHNGSFARYPFWDDHILVIVYPFLPWFGLMLCGYCAGKIFTSAFDQGRRKKILLQLGLTLVATFVVLRLLNIYGDPQLWKSSSSVMNTFFSFMNVDKYPPSLLFICITLGPALIFLSLFNNTKNKLTEKISVYGRVPFFYYILHFYLLHALCMVLFLSRGHSFSEPTVPVFGITFKFLNAGEGYSLSMVYLIWILVVVALYPLCKWFSDYKKTHQQWWLSYL